MKQKERIMEYMKEHGSITQLEATNHLGILRLGARIWDLKHDGVAIKKELVCEKNRYGENTCFARYTLEDTDA